MARKKQSNLRRLCLRIPDGVRFREAFQEYEQLLASGRKMEAARKASERSILLAAAAFVEVRSATCDLLCHVESGSREMIAAVFGFDDWADLDLDYGHLEAIVHRLPSMRVVSRLRALYHRREPSIWSSDLWGCARLAELVDELDRVWEAAHELAYQGTEISIMTRARYADAYRRVGLAW